MSGQDEKSYTIDRAKAKYILLCKLFKKIPDVKLPFELEQAIAAYEKQGAICQSEKFEMALRDYWTQLKVPTELKPELEKIVNLELPFFGLWCPDYFERLKKGDS